MVPPWSPSPNRRSVGRAGSRSNWRALIGKAGARVITAPSRGGSPAPYAPVKSQLDETGRSRWRPESHPVHRRDQLLPRSLPDRNRNRRARHRRERDLPLPEHPCLPCTQWRPATHAFARHTRQDLMPFSRSPRSDSGITRDVPSARKTSGTWADLRYQVPILAPAGGGKAAPVFRRGRARRLAGSAIVHALVPTDRIRGQAPATRTPPALDFEETESSHEAGGQGPYGHAQHSSPPRSMAYRSKSVATAIHRQSLRVLNELSCRDVTAFTFASAAFDSQMTHNRLV